MLGLYKGNVLPGVVSVVSMRPTDFASYVYIYPVIPVRISEVHIQFPYFETRV